MLADFVIFVDTVLQQYVGLQEVVVHTYTHAHYGMYVQHTSYSIVNHQSSIINK